MARIEISKLKSFWGKDPLNKGDAPHTGTEAIIISSDGFIVNGHKRVRHAKAIGQTKIECIQLSTKFVDTEPIRFLDSELKKMKRWDLVALLRKAILIR